MTVGMERRGGGGGLKLCDDAQDRAGDGQGTSRGLARDWRGTWMHVCRRLSPVLHLQQTFRIVPVWPVPSLVRHSHINPTRLIIYLPASPRPELLRHAQHYIIPSSPATVIAGTWPRSWILPHAYPSHRTLTSLRLASPRLTFVAGLDSLLFIVNLDSPLFIASFDSTRLFL
jgi:hypothetical protein